MIHLSDIRRFCFFSKITVRNNADVRNNIVSWQQFVPSSDFDLQFYIHNNFAKKFNLSECMPNLTNEEFTTEVCNFFGLAKYIDSTKKEVELKRNLNNKRS